MLQELFTPSVQHALDLAGIFVFAISGALLAVRKNFDVFGIAVLAEVTALGGGLFRDLVIGAVLVAGARAPRLVRRADLARMKPGAVIVDVAIDQGGCVETSRPTTHRDPTFVVDGVVHYCVTNMPGAVGRTMQRNPTWQVEVSTGSGKRAAGRYRRQ